MVYRASSLYCLVMPGPILAALLTVGAQASLSMEVSAGFQGIVRPDRRLLLEILIENQGQDLAGTIDVESRGVTYRRSMSLPSPSRKQVRLILPPKPPDPPLVVSFKMDGVPMVQVEPSLLYLVAGKAVTFRVLEGLSAPVVSRSFSPDGGILLTDLREDFPTDEVELAPVDEIQIDAKGLSGLTTDQREALRLWTRLGGRCRVLGPVDRTTITHVWEEAPSASQLQQRLQWDFGLGQIMLQAELEDGGASSQTAQFRDSNQPGFSLIVPQLGRAVLSSLPSAELGETKLGQSWALLFASYLVLVLAGLVWAGRANSRSSQPILAAVALLATSISILAARVGSAGQSAMSADSIINVFEGETKNWLSSRIRVRSSVVRRYSQRFELLEPVVHRLEEKGQTESTIALLSDGRTTSLVFHQNLWQLDSVLIEGFLEDGLTVREESEQILVTGFSFKSLPDCFFFDGSQQIQVPVELLEKGFILSPLRSLQTPKQSSERPKSLLTERFFDVASAVRFRGLYVCSCGELPVSDLRLRANSAGQSETVLALWLTRFGTTSF